MKANILERKIARKFTHSGRDGKYVKLFENLSRPQQKELLTLFPLEAEEIPAIGGRKESAFSILLTTKRLLWTNIDEKKSLHLKDISEVIFDMHFERLKTKPRSVLNEVEVKDTSGVRFKIPVENGFPFVGLLNVLIFLAKQNKPRNAV